MKQLIVIAFLLMTKILSSNAQQMIHDTAINGNSIVHKDVRVDMLGKRMLSYNESLANKIQMVNGYRLMVLNTTDRTKAMQVRAAILQQLPEHKIYMTFLSPYIKIKMGNFTDRVEAEKMQKKIIELNIVSGNIYILNEKVEQKPVEKTAVQSDDQ